MGVRTGLRTHTCGELRATDEGATVRLAGWVHRHRDKGGVIFVDLRDRYGIIQVTLDAESVAADVVEVARDLRSEYAIGVEGTVRSRGDMTNPDLPTGAVEVVATRITVLNESAVLPFGLDEHDRASEELRLEHRYLDLRRPELQAVLGLRHRVCQATRRHLNAEEFFEIETPVMVRPTPEGARDYLVPSRVRPGSFYALPQSPQLYKQVLMASGFDRYYQIARCMRDEDLRADRQPEFSQIDLEMSFVTEEDVFALVEGLMVEILKDGVGVDLPVPFPRVSHADAMNRFGSDKPDLRYPTELVDVTDALEGTGFRAFADTIAKGGVVKGIRVEARHEPTRKVLDELEEVAKRYGAKGLARVKVKDGALDTGIAKFLSEEEQKALVSTLGGEEGDVLLFVADRWNVACNALGQVRLAVGRRFTPPSPTDFRFLWVHDFPLFEEDPDTGALAPCHHIFTQPRDEHLEFLDEEPLRVHAQLYDLALNGVELGSGSIRVHNRALQEKLLRLIGMEREEAERRFGFLLRALEYGAPPHGGIALGLERIIMILAGRDSIRDTIAFPKTASAASLMDGSPAPVDPRDLEELHLALRPTETSSE